MVDNKMPLGGVSTRNWKALVYLLLFRHNVTDFFIFCTMLCYVQDSVIKARQMTNETNQSDVKKAKKSHAMLHQTNKSLKYSNAASNALNMSKKHPNIKVESCTLKQYPSFSKRSRIIHVGKRSHFLKCVRTFFPRPKIIFYHLHSLSFVRKMKS